MFLYSLLHVRLYLLHVWCDISVISRKTKTRFEILLPWSSCRSFNNLSYFASGTSVRESLPNFTECNKITAFHSFGGLYWSRSLNSSIFSQSSICLCFWWFLINWRISSRSVKERIPIFPGRELPLTHSDELSDIQLHKTTCTCVWCLRNWPWVYVGL